MKKRKKIRQWTYGQKTLLSEKTGVARSYISDIFNRKVGCGKNTALKILKAADEMGLELAFEDLIFNDTTKNPLFTSENTDTENYGKPGKTENLIENR